MKQADTQADTQAQPKSQSGAQPAAPALTIDFGAGADDSGADLKITVSGQRAQRKPAKSREGSAPSGREALWHQCRDLK